MSKECTTHHHACDCREEKFKQLEQENAALRENFMAAESEIILLREDKERLEWLISKAPFNFFKDLGPDLVKGRQQIDAARKEAQP